MAAVVATAASDAAPAVDPRDITQGQTMLSDAYLDQPYCTILQDTGRWVCTVTDNDLKEGSTGEHVVVLWSDDRGETWSKQVSVEPDPIAHELDNAYSMIIASNPGIVTVPKDAPATATTQRLYVVYNMNVNNITSFPDGQHISRVDMMGTFNMRYSDDAGETWSKDRYSVPYRLTPIDYNNDWKGNTTIMWTVDQLKIRDDVAYFAFTKIGKYMLGPPEEWWVMRSDNILTAKDAADVTWTLLPHGDHGIQPITGFEKDNFEEVRR